jgi:nucleoside-diphosphate kinase
MYLHPSTNTRNTGHTARSEEFSAMRERTLIIIKPDGVERGYTEQIFDRFKGKGFTVVERRDMTISRALAEKHYAEHKEKPFYPSLVEYITSGPVVVAILEGENAVAEARALMGPTDPAKAPPGTIRGDFGESIDRNTIHGSDSADSARREIALFFGDDES